MFWLPTQLDILLLLAFDVNDRRTECLDGKDLFRTDESSNKVLTLQVCPPVITTGLAR